jgi:hypothetical protein
VAIRCARWLAVLGLMALMCLLAPPAAAKPLQDCRPAAAAALQQASNDVRSRPNVEEICAETQGLQEQDNAIMPIPSESPVSSTEDPAWWEPAWNMFRAQTSTLKGKVVWGIIGLIIYGVISGVSRFARDYKGPDDDDFYHPS